MKSNHSLSNISDWEFRIIKDLQLLDIDEYSRQVDIDFNSEEDAINHFLSKGQYFGLDVLVYPFFLKNKNNKLIDWQSEKIKTRVPHKISIIIPVYNEIKLTLQCLHAVYRYTGLDYEVLVVDNGSSKATYIALKIYATFFKKVRILRLKENYNFSVGCNYGFANSNGEYVLFLNNDTRVTRKWLEPLVKMLEIKGRIAVQPKLIYPNSKIQSVGVEFGDDGFGFNRFSGGKDNIELHNSESCPALTAACIVLKADTFASVRGFDALFINGQEDIDLSLRLRQSYGENSLWYCADSTVVHFTSQTEGRGKYISQNRKIFQMRWKESSLLVQS